MRKKLMKRIISLIIIATLLISPTTVNAATPTQDTKQIQSELHTIELGNNSKINMVENDAKRIVAYYQGDTLKQLAVLQKETGDIYYYDVSECSIAFKNYSISENDVPKTYTAKYNIRDFMLDTGAEKIYDINNTSVYSNQEFRYLKSKIYDDLGQTYKRYLYGYTDSKQYEQNSWQFAAGTSLTVVMAVIGFMKTIDPRIAALASAAGILLSALTTKEWIKELFWVYQFKQTSPTAIEFICSRTFTYEKQRRVEINGDEGYWETIEKESDISIELTRDDILTTPGLYW